MPNLAAFKGPRALAEGSRGRSNYRTRTLVGHAHWPARFSKPTRNGMDKTGNGPGWKFISCASSTKWPTDRLSNTAYD